MQVDDTATGNGDIEARLESDFAAEAQRQTQRLQTQEQPHQSVQDNDSRDSYQNHVVWQQRRFSKCDAQALEHAVRQSLLSSKAEEARRLAAQRQEERDCVETVRRFKEIESELQEGTPVPDAAQAATWSTADVIRWFEWRTGKEQGKGSFQMDARMVDRVFRPNGQCMQRCTMSTVKPYLSSLPATCWNIKACARIVRRL